MQEILIGKITNYYPKIGVGVVELKKDLLIGDKIRIERPSGSFSQIVKSMQIDHQALDHAKEGTTIGLKLDEPAQKGCMVYKIIKD